MKRSPIKRKRKKAREGDDPARLAFVRTMPCCVEPFLAFTYHSGPVEAHHPIGLRWGKGMGTKSADRFAIPLCHGHHMEFHGRTGTFASDNPRMEHSSWQDHHVARLLEIPTCK